MVKKQITISSADRVGGGTSSSFTISIPQQMISVRPTSWSLMDVQLPNSIYNVTTLNNRLDFIVLGTTYAATIPTGAYTNGTLTVALATALNALSAGFSVVSNANQLTITITNSTNAFTILGATGANRAASILPIMGFPATDQVGASGATGLTGSSCYNLGSPLSIYLLINEIGGVNTTSSNLLYTFRIPINTSSSGQAYFDKNQMYEQLVVYNGQALQTMTCNLMYKGGQAVNLNGIDFEFTLEYTS